MWKLLQGSSANTIADAAGDKWEATEGTGSRFSSLERAVLCIPTPPGLTAAWGKGLGAAGLGKGDGICAWRVSSASVPLWLRGWRQGGGQK